MQEDSCFIFLRRATNGGKHIHGRKAFQNAPKLAKSEHAYLVVGPHSCRHQVNTSARTTFLLLLVVDRDINHYARVSRQLGCSSCVGGLTLRSRLLLLAFHAGQGLGYLPKQGLDIVAYLGRSLHEDGAGLLGLLFALGGGDFSLGVAQVGLVADEDDDDIVPPFSSHIVYPLLRLLEGLLRRDVVDDHCDGGVADVGGDQRSESFLPCGVP